MTFTKKLTQISKLLFFFGISPYFFNRKSNKFECSIYTLTYTFVYSLTISSAIIYILFAYHTEEKIGRSFSTTYITLGLLQQSIVIILSSSIMLDLIVKRQMHATFLNNLIELDANLVKLKISSNNDSDLNSLHLQHILIIFIYASVYFINSIIYVNYVRFFEHVWNALQFFQTVSLTLVGYYIRCLATIITHRCRKIFRRLDVIRRDLLQNNYNQDLIAELLKGFKSFDELMNLKNQLSNLYGIQLLLITAFDFIVLTISVYGILYYQTQSIAILYYFVMYNLSHGISCVLLVLALETLSNQV